MTGLSELSFDGKTVAAGPITPAEATETLLPIALWLAGRLHAKHDAAEPGHPPPRLLVGLTGSVSCRRAVATPPPQRLMAAEWSCVVGECREGRGSRRLPGCWPRAWRRCPPAASGPRYNIDYHQQRWP